MAKKKKVQSTAPVPLTRGQISRAERERRRIRSLYTAAVALGALTIMLLALAVITQYVLRPNQEVAAVNGKVITRADYNKLRRWSLYQQLQQQSLQQQFSQDTSQLGSQLEILSAQLQNVEEETVDPGTVTQLIDNEVLRQASTTEGIDPTVDELREAAIKEFIPQPTPPATPTETVSAVATITSTTAITPTATRTPTKGPPTSTPTITPTLPPVPGAEQTAEAGYSRYMKIIELGTAPQREPACRFGCPDLNENDYLTMLVEPIVRREKVVEKLSATEVMTQVEQIDVQHILTATQEGALKIKAELDEGADFTELANTQSSEQIENASRGLTPNGGELGWRPREDSGLVEPFIAAAWEVPAGEYSDPVQTDFGWHIIKVKARDPKRALDETQIETAKNELYDEWFKKAKESADIRPVQATPVPPTSVPLIEPTPAAAPTTGVVTGTTTLTGTATTSGAAEATQAATETTQPEPGITPSP